MDKLLIDKYHKEKPIQNNTNNDIFEIMFPEIMNNNNHDKE